ncbi:nickel pincer cofactor biosynthesis protein LarB [Caldicellulosiruptoraceae bacterium PP1]
MDLEKLLFDVKNNNISIDEAIKKLKNLPYEDLGYAKIDHHRKLRQGISEVIYCEGKTHEQVLGIINKMLEKGSYNIIGTRVSNELYNFLYDKVEKLEYYKDARIICVNKKEINMNNGFISVVAAGTSDMKVSEEAAVTAELLGNNVKRVYDVGVAGIHRLFAHLDDIQNANVVIAVAGMEGALASVVAGLVSKPVIAVPTSVGYGANFHGLSALLTMLNSCASGVSVVNIDNGFGAGVLAHMINSLASK